MLIDFEHCFLNLAIPLERLPAPDDARRLAEVSLSQARILAARQVLTPKTILRARNEFFSWREATGAVKEAFRDGFVQCWRAICQRREELLEKLARRLLEEPFLRVGTWRFRRALAPFDVAEMRERPSKDLDEVVALFVAEA